MKVNKFFQHFKLFDPELIYTILSSKEKIQQNLKSFYALICFNQAKFFDRIYFFFAESITTLGD